MSEVQRYNPVGDGVAKTDVNGPLVAYGDYCVLKAENERLLESRNRYMEISDELDAHCNQLKAEVERLRASSFVTAVPVEEYERLRKELAESQENYHLVNEIIKGERNVHRTNTMMLKDQIDGLIVDNQLLGERVLAYQRLKQLNDISRPSNEA